VATLFVVGTPIGNLGDLTPRACETLAGVGRILAEDTRRSRVVADRAGADAPLVSLHRHNEQKRVSEVLAWMREGMDVALVSDAGMPLVSDPGARLVEAVLEAGHQIVPIPGPSAVIAALVASGLPADRFTFLGFPERKGGAREAQLARIAEATETSILFESPIRLGRLLRDLSEVCGPDRRVAVARELTKLHEEVFRGTLAEAEAYYEGRPPKGELTVVVEGSGDGTPEPGDEEAARSLARALRADGLRPSEVARELSQRAGMPRNEAYRIAHEVAPESERS